MFRKEEKKALTRIGLLAIGWPIGLDRFYDGRTREGVFSLLGWAVIFGSLMFLTPCPYEYGSTGKQMVDMTPEPLIILPLVLGAYGGFLVLRKGFRLLRQFESSEE